MATILNSTIPTGWSAADMVAHLGDIPLERIRMHPPPGMATERDVVATEAREDRLCALIDGVLVEKTVGNYESLLAAYIIRFLGAFVDEHQLGIVLAPDAMLRILPEQVRMPDVCFISWNRLPDRQLPSGLGKPTPFARRSGAYHAQGTRRQTRGRWGHWWTRVTR